MHQDLPSPLQLLVDTGPYRARLVVFSDDWGRHPSSAQHLIRQLLPRYQVDWSIRSEPIGHGCRWRISGAGWRS